MVKLVTINADIRKLACRHLIELPIPNDILNTELDYIAINGTLIYLTFYLTKPGYGLGIIAEVLALRPLNVLSDSIAQRDLDDKEKPYRKVRSF